MMLNRSLTAAGVTALALSFTAIAPALASPARPAPLRCNASMSNNKPRDNSTTVVRVRTNSRAHVVTVAHYKTTNHRKQGQAGSKGRLGVPYDISRATPGFRVKVSVTVSRGDRSGSCSTSFTPQR
jgi:hypothetical protein